MIKSGDSKMGLKWVSCIAEIGSAKFKNKTAMYPKSLNVISVYRYLYIYNCFKIVFTFHTLNTMAKANFTVWWGSVSCLRTLLCRKKQLTWLHHLMVQSVWPHRLEILTPIWLRYQECPQDPEIQIKNSNFRKPMKSKMVALSVNKPKPVHYSVY